MKILIAPDSFKGSLTAEQAAKSMAAGVSDYDPTIETVLLPIADGGEGTVKCLVHATNGQLLTAIVQDPLGRKRAACYGILGDQQTCVIEIAEASGLMQLNEHERNPLETSTYETGELIVHALNAGYRKFIIGLGGSATNDGGMGLLQALGMKFVDAEGAELGRGGGLLSKLQTIEDTAFDIRALDSHFIIASDVTNPLIGPNGASAIFGPQKGATEEMVHILDRNLIHFANVVEAFTGCALHDKTGAGAAGGTGGAIQAFLPSTMQKGIEVVLDAISFEAQLEDATLILTGEGKTDGQTLAGKAAYGIAQAAKGKPVLLISGMIAADSIDELSAVFTKLHTLTSDTVSTEQAIQHAAHYLRLKTREVLASFTELSRMM